MITMNKVTISLSFYIIGSSLVVYMITQSFLWVIIQNVAYLLVGVFMIIRAHIDQKRKRLYI